MSIKFENCEDVVKNSTIIYGAGAKDDGRLDMAVFSDSKLFFSEGVLAFVVLGEFLGPDDFHDKKKISLYFPYIASFVNKWMIDNFLKVDLMNGLPSGKCVLKLEGEFNKVKDVLHLSIFQMYEGIEV